MQNLLQKWFQETHSHFWDQDFDHTIADDSGNPVDSLPYQLWNVSKYGLCVDAAITGVMPPPLMEISVVVLLNPILAYLSFSASCIIFKYHDLD